MRATKKQAKGKILGMPNIQERKQKGEYHTLVKETMLFDQEYLSRMFRMIPSKFEALLKLVGPKITLDNTRREVINPSERLCVTLRYLVTGDRKVQFCVLWSDKMYVVT